MSMDLTRVLEATASPDTQALQLAQQQLEQAAASNMPAFLTALSNELADVSKSEVARMAAGLQLKNYLTHKNPETRLQYQTAWLTFDLAIKAHIKTLVMRTLGTEPQHHRSAAQCVAYIAAVELRNNQWPELIPSLVFNVTGAQSTEALKEASLEAIGYVCEEIEPRFLASHANEILTAIVQGMRKEEPSNSVRLAATRALLNSLEFTKANFEKEAERHFIMQVVCEATQCNCVPVQTAALQNLVKIMSLYYQYMETYMGPALFAITLEAMKSDQDFIALQGIEFWSTVCDEEADLAIEAAEAQDQGRQPEQTSKFYVKGAMQYLVPILLLRLARQEEFDDEDDWNPCKAAGVCLSLMAGCCEDAIVAPIIAFVNEHLKNPDWKFRDAAVMALGSCLEGPDPNALQPYLTEVMELLIELMADEMVQVRDSAAWTIGRVCENTPQAVLYQQHLAKLLEALLKGLDGEPRVATNVCWALSSLAEAAFDSATENTEGDPPTYILSSSFTLIVEKLLTTTDRTDSGMGNLRSSAYEALMDLVKYSAQDCYAAVQSTIMTIMKRLNYVLQLDSQLSGSGADRQHLTDIASLLCATLQSLLRKANKADAATVSETVMQALVAMFVSSSGQTGGVQEDAIMTVGVLVEAIGDQFEKYMEEFKPYLLLALSNFAEYQVCIAAVGLVGDLCRSLGSKMTPYAAEIMSLLCQNLSNPAVHRSLKPQILSAIGDMALSLGALFQPYLPVVLQILQEATQLNLQVDKSDYDTLDYMNELREGCLEAYTGIVQGLKGENDSKVNEEVKVLWPHVPFIIQFIEHLAKDEERTDSIVACCAGLFGDLCTAFGPHMAAQVASGSGIPQLLHEGKRSRIKRTKMLSTWALNEMKQRLQSS